jgi:hypothetical protein
MNNKIKFVETPKIAIFLDFTQNISNEEMIEICEFAMKVQGRKGKDEKQRLLSFKQNDDTIELYKHSFVRW